MTQDIAKTPFTIDDALALATQKHAFDVDKLGKPYILHVTAVGDALADFPDDIRIAGYLHDVIEDTGTSAGDLAALGVSPRAIEIISRVSRNLHPQMADYQAGIRYVAVDHDATLVKIADNAHNSDPERVAKLAEGNTVPSQRYREARRALYTAVPASEIRLILNRVNPSLLPELAAIEASAV